MPGRNSSLARLAAGRLAVSRLRRGVDPARQIIAIGGVTAEEDLALFPYIVAQARRTRLRVGFLPTASGDSEDRKVLRALLEPLLRAFRSQAVRARAQLGEIHPRTECHP